MPATSSSSTGRRPRPHRSRFSTACRSCPSSGPSDRPPGAGSEAKRVIVNKNIPVTGDGKWIVQHEGFERHVAPPPVEPGGRSAAGLDVDRLIQSLVHWRWLILGCVLAGMLLGLLAAMATTQMYRATVTLE